MNNFNDFLRSKESSELTFDSNKIEEGVGTIALGVMLAWAGIKVIRAVAKKVVGKIGSKVKLEPEKLKEITLEIVKKVAAESGSGTDLLMGIALKRAIDNKIDSGEIQTIEGIQKEMESYLAKNESLVNESKIILKRQYTENHPAVTAGKSARIRNKMLEAIADGQITQEEFNNILKEYSKDSSKWIRRNSKFFNVSEEGISLSKFGKKALEQITVNEAETIKDEGKEEFEGKTYPVKIKENKNMKKTFIYESFSEFVNSINESAGLVTEAFKSMKLQSILTGAKQMPSDLPKAFYDMAKIALDKVEDADIIEMDPDVARKEKRNNAVYLYFTTNEKENPYAGKNSYGVGTIPANTLLAITNGKNEWLNTGWASWFGSKGKSRRTLSVTTRDDSAGFEKGGTRDTWRSGISSLTKAAELADRAYVLDLDILRARYSTAAKTGERAAAKKGATAFKNDKDFKTENLNRYHMILADRASKMPIDEEVKKAIDIVADQIKTGVAAGKKGRYGDVIIGEDPKGREVKLRDASNAMSNLLDDFNRYVEYTNNAEKEKQAGYTGDYYQREVKNYAKSIRDRISKIQKMDYAW